jgi:hypothetical protein
MKIIGVGFVSYVSQLAFNFSYGKSVTTRFRQNLSRGTEVFKLIGRDVVFQTPYFFVNLSIGMDNFSKMVLVLVRDLCIIIPLIMWNIWCDRNKVVFDQHQSIASSTVVAVHTQHQVFGLTNSSHGPRPTREVRCWQHGDVNTTVLNVNGSADTDQGKRALEIWLETIRIPSSSPFTVVLVFLMCFMLRFKLCWLALNYAGKQVIRSVADFVHVVISNSVFVPIICVIFLH